MKRVCIDVIWLLFCLPSPVGDILPGRPGMTLQFSTMNLLPYILTHLPMGLGQRHQGTVYHSPEHGYAK